MASATDDASPCLTSIIKHPRITSTLMCNLAFTDIVNLASTCQAMKSQISANIDTHTIHLLSKYFCQPKLILYLLRATRAVISGSLALLALFPQQETVTWIAADVDIFVPHSQFQHLISNLCISDDYKPCKVIQKVYGDARIHKVVQLSNGRTSIDLVTTNSEASISAIFSFHSSIVMNFISGYGIYSAYPRLTLQKTGFTNPLYIVGGNPLPEKVASCIEKYKRRGFAITSPPKVARNCGNDPACPHTIRSIYDGHSLFLPFHRLTTGPEYGIISTKFIYDTRHDVLWRMGGPACYGTREGRGKQFIQEIQMKH